MGKKVSDRAFKTMQTKCDNIFKKLKLEIEELYIERAKLFEEVIFFHAVKEHEKYPELNVKELNIARQEMLIKLVNINSKIENIVLSMAENHKKKKDNFLRWQESQEVINGFRRG